MTVAVATAELSDADIATRVAAGERPLFETLVRRHNQRMYRAARAVTRSDGRAAVAAVLTHTIGDVYHFDGARCDRITAYVMCNVLDSAQ